MNFEETTDRLGKMAESLKKDLDKELDSLMKDLTPEQRADMNRYSIACSNIMTDTKMSKEEKELKVRELEAQMYSKYGIKSNK
jgi:hypothetical protein